jgi:hypothetical protein
MGNYVVDWSREGIGRKPTWDYRGKWQSEAYEPSRGMWKLDRPLINPAALMEHERFKWCAWSPACGEILDYLKVYAKYPRIELLAKMEGGARFAARVGFVRQLQADRGLMRFFMAHVAEIKRIGYGCDVIRQAYRRGITLGQAQVRIEHRRRWRAFHLPLAIDASRALEYCALQKAGEWQYCEYLRACRELGLDLGDTKVAFPKRLKARAAVISDQVAEIRRRNQAELAKQMDIELGAAAAEASRLERVRSKAFRVVIPRRRADLVREGKRLSNCLGDGHYAGKMARRETLIAFIRQAARPGVAFVAVEYSFTSKCVLQCYGAKNQRPAKPVLDFVNRVFEKVA